MKSIQGLLVGVALAGCAAEAGPADKIAGSPVSLAKAPALDKSITAYFTSLAGQRTYIQTDKPLYQPGETIWFRADVRDAKTLHGGAPGGASVQLVSPRGAVVATKNVLVLGGIARNDFVLDAAAEGGEYAVQLIGPRGVRDEKKIIVNTYEAPRLMKTLELLRKAYGEGDQVSAAVELKRTTGEAFADKPATAVVTIDDVEVQRLPIKTDKDGKTIVRFQLPTKIARGDGLLAVMVEDGGVTETIQKRIPIVLKTLSLGVFPEGGDLVAGVPGRVYFMAKNPLGKPADIEGNVVDDQGKIAAQFRSVHDGMGKFELTPAADRRYHLEVTKPANIVTRVDVPAAKSDGCVLRALDQKPDLLRVAAICKAKQHLAIEATLRENRLAGGGFDVEAGKPALVELPISRATQGAVRVTLFDGNKPLSERLVFHGTPGLKITLTADRKTYAPRDRVKLHVHTTDAHGNPIKANVAVAVVDDTVLSYADDKSGKILAHVLLESELGATPTDPIEEPNFYFSDKPEAAAAMDALLATRGYRKFEWRLVP